MSPNDQQLKSAQYHAVPKTQYIPQIQIRRLVDHAIFLVANNSRTWLPFQTELRFSTRHLCAYSFCSVLRPASSRSSTVRLVSVPLYRAISRTTATAALSRPCPRRERGDSCN